MFVRINEAAKIFGLGRFFAQHLNPARMTSFALLGGQPRKVALPLECVIRDESNKVLSTNLILRPPSKSS